MSRMLPSRAALFLVAAIAGCAGSPASPEPDVMDVTLHAPVEQVTAAVADVLSQDGYTVDQDDSGNVTTGMRQEI